MRDRGSVFQLRDSMVVASILPFDLSEFQGVSWMLNWKFFISKR